MISVRCLHDLDLAQVYRDEINALNQVSARPGPFSTFEFYRNYVLHSGLFPATASLWFLLLFRGDQLIGYLALKRRVSLILGFRAATIDMLTAHVGDHQGLVTRAEDEATATAAVYAYLLDRKREWSLLEFQQQDATSPLLALRVAAAAGCRIRQWPNDANAIIPIRWPSLKDYFSDFSKKFRSNVSRQIRTLMAAGEVEVLTSSDPLSNARLFELYCRIEANSWKARTNARLAQHDQWIRLYTGLLQPGQPMQLVIQVLLLEGVPIAGLISGGFSQGLYALHIVYDHRMARLAPGSAILLMGLRHAIEKQYKFFNLLWGYGYYKTRWLAQLRETTSLQIYNIGTPFDLQRRLGDLGRRYFKHNHASEIQLTNPAKQEAIGMDNSAADESRIRQLCIEERSRHAVVSNLARHGACESLTAPQLTALLPFNTQRG